MARLPVVPWSMARTWLTSEPLRDPRQDVLEHLFAPEIDREGMKHIRVLDERLVGERNLREQLTIGPLVNKVVDPRDEKEGRDGELFGLPAGSGLVGQEIE